MLINLSNHPSSAWSAEQIKLANEQFDSITDLAFPQISPDADIDAVLALAEEYTYTCSKLLMDENKDRSAVHIMGEMTFTYNVVHYLSCKCIDTVASTTERIATVDALGQKISTFKFVQFRPYHSINELPF
jgi:hypothetical protein